MPIVIGPGLGISSHPESNKASIWPELDDEDFRIESRGWKILTLPFLRFLRRRVTANGFYVFVNPEGDVWEVETEAGPKIQLFTYAAALRETAKAWKRMPTVDQWLALGRSKIYDSTSWWEREPSQFHHGECLYWGKTVYFAGCLTHEGEHLAGEAWYWLAGEWTAEGRPCARMSNDNATKTSLAPGTFGMAVRCLKDKPTAVTSP